MAGCAGGDDAGGSAVPTTLAGPTDPAAGSLVGVVTDAEGLPLADAEVAILETQQATQTDDEGRFAFYDLEPGAYRLVASKLGFSQTALRADVRAGEETQLDVRLEPIQVTQEPYHFSYPFTAHIVFGESFVDIVTHEVTNAVCEPCHFYIPYEKGIENGVLEVIWEPSVSAPSVNEDVFFAMFVNWEGENDTTKYRGGDNVGSGYQSNRQPYWHTSSDLDLLNEFEMVRLDVHAGISVAVDMKIDLWWTVAYVEELPESFTALPPED